MNRSRLLGLLSAALFLPFLAQAQSTPPPMTTIKDGIVGAWMLVSVVSQRDDAGRGEPFGSHPKGIMVFTADGRFSLFQSTAEIPRLAANDRARATPDEAMTIVRDSIAYYGTYTVDENARELAVRIDGSTYANLSGGPPQRRIITSLTSTELAFTNPRTPNGMTLYTVWQRATAR